MTTYYFSGIDRHQFVELLAKEGASGMVNANVAHQPAMLETYRRFPDVRLVLDSGAFQGNENLQGYADLIRRVGHRFEWVANLDVIGNQAASNQNYDALTTVLPGNLTNKVLWIFQGGNLDYLKTQADQRRIVGVGGLVPLIKKNPRQALEFIEMVGCVLKSVEARCHLFGVGSYEIIAPLRGETWLASVDSQSWLCGYKSRELIRQNGSRLSCEIAGLNFTRKEAAAQNIRTIHSWLSGDIQLSLLGEIGG